MASAGQWDGLIFANAARALSSCHREFEGTSRTATFLEFLSRTSSAPRTTRRCCKVLWAVCKNDKIDDLIQTSAGVDESWGDARVYVKQAPRIFVLCAEAMVASEEACGRSIDWNAEAPTLWASLAALLSADFCRNPVAQGTLSRDSAIYLVLDLGCDETWSRARNLLKRLLDHNSDEPLLLLAQAERDLNPPRVDHPLRLTSALLRAYDSQVGNIWSPLAGAEVPFRMGKVLRALIRSDVDVYGAMSIADSISASLDGQMRQEKKLDVDDVLNSLRDHMLGEQQTLWLGMLKQIDGRYVLLENGTSEVLSLQEIRQRLGDWVVDEFSLAGFDRPLSFTVERIATRLLRITALLAHTDLNRIHYAHTANGAGQLIFEVPIEQVRAALIHMVKPLLTAPPSYYFERAQNAAILGTTGSIGTAESAILFCNSAENYFRRVCGMHGLFEEGHAPKTIDRRARAELTKKYPAATDAIAEFVREYTRLASAIYGNPENELLLEVLRRARQLLDEVDLTTGRKGSDEPQTRLMENGDQCDAI